MRCVLCNHCDDLDEVFDKNSRNPVRMFKLPSEPTEKPVCQQCINAIYDALADFNDDDEKEMDDQQGS